MSTQNDSPEYTTLTLHKDDLQRLKRTKELLFGSAGEDVPHRAALNTLCQRVESEEGN